MASVGFAWLRWASLAREKGGIERSGLKTLNLDQTLRHFILQSTEAQTGRNIVPQIKQLNILTEQIQSMYDTMMACIYNFSLVSRISQE